MSKRDKRLMQSIEAVANRHKADAIEKAGYRDTRQIYSVFTMALWELLETDSDDEKMQMIETLFARTQEIWNEAIASGIDVSRLCFLKTGIEIHEFHEVIDA